MSIAGDSTRELERTGARLLPAARPNRGVLVPLDGTRLAEEALALGASLARRAAAALHLVSAVEPMLETVRRELPDLAEREILEETAGRQLYLERIAETVRAARPGVVTTTVLSGQPGEAIADYAAREELDLIVLTTHGRGRLARWCVGSVADTLLRHSRTPLLLLHAGDTPRLGEFRHIVVGLEGEHDHQILDAALRLGALSPGARYVLLGVAERYPDAEARLGARAGELAEQGVRASWEVVRRGSVTRALGEVGRAVRADCLAVGTRGLTGLNRALLGSAAARLMRQSSLPLLLVPFPSPESQAGLTSRSA